MAARWAQANGSSRRKRAFAPLGRVCRARRRLGRGRPARSRQPPGRARNPTSPLRKRVRAGGDAEERHGARRTLGACKPTLSRRNANCRGQAIEAERSACAQLDQAEAAKERIATRLEELAQSQQPISPNNWPRPKVRAPPPTGSARRPCPAPDAGRAALEAAQSQARSRPKSGVQAALAELAAHDQSLAVIARTAWPSAAGIDNSNWQARSGEATQARRRSGPSARRNRGRKRHHGRGQARLSDRAEIEQGDAIARLTEGTGSSAGRDGPNAKRASASTRNALGRTQTQEALAQAREGRATLAARAENEEARRRRNGAHFRRAVPMPAPTAGRALSSSTRTASKPRLRPKARRWTALPPAASALAL